MGVLTRSPVCNRLNNLPQHSFKLWTTYEIQRSPLQGFGVGTRCFFVGDRQGDLNKGTPKNKLSQFLDSTRLFLPLQELP
ncbi:hypothetical protein [uncultured Nostoc sp.]|uniref:hypothetical protein n=1 Tax=uncultured Nostoc sp. TaxID=340711 RepID=UPI0035C9DD80